MLSHWLKMIKPAPSYQALVEACSRPSVKCYELASEIAKKYDIPLPDIPESVHSKTKYSNIGSSDSSSVELPPVDLGPHFPYLSTTNMSEEEITHYQLKLSEETSKIKQSFAGLFLDLKKRIEATSKLEDVLTLLEIYDKNNFKKLSDCQSLGEVFKALSDFVSFFDYDPLKLLARKLGSPEVKRKFEAYKKKFQRFSKRRVCEIPQDAFIEGWEKKERRIYVIKTDDSLSLDELTAKDLKKFEYRLNRILGHEQLRLLKVEDGCVKLHFLTLSQRKGGLNLSTQAQQALRKLGVLTVSCGGQMVDLTKASINNPESESGFYTGKSETTDETEAQTPDEEKQTQSTPDQYKEKDLVDPRLEMMNTADLRRKVQPDLSPLHRAAFAGDLDQLRFLIEEEKANPLDTDTNNNTLLHLVAEWGELEVLQYLIEEVGCNPATGGWYGATVLHSAAAANQLQVVKYLVEHCQMDPTNVFNDSNMSPLVYACMGGDLETVQYLVQQSREMTASMDEALYLEHRRAKPTAHVIHVTEDPAPTTTYESIVCPNEYYSEPLSCACFCGHLPIVRYLVEECGCDPLRKEGERLKTPLESAVLQGHMHIVQYLASTERVRNDSHYQHELCLVYYAVERSDVAMATYLVRTLGCDPNVPYIDFTPLHTAVKQNDLNMAKMLIEELGCDTTSGGKYGPEPIHLAAQFGHVSMLKYLVEEKGCSPSSMSDIGITPLYSAVVSGHLDAVCYLVNEQGCSPKYGGGKFHSPLYIAACKGHLDILRLFVTKLDCDPNARDFQGNTLLHAACHGGSIPVIQYLIQELGADKNALGPYGHTPLSTAALAGYIPVVSYLLEKEGCKVRDGLSLTPLDYASIGGHLDLVKYLMQSQPHLSVLHDLPTSLIIACRTGQLEVLQYLAEKKVGGCEPNSVVDLYGNTLVHYAARGGHVHILHYLIHHLSCNHMRRNKFRNMPLHSAALAGKVEAVQLLLEANKSSDTSVSSPQGEKGYEPVHFAAAGGDLSTLRFLVEEVGVDPTGTDTAGLTPLHLASRQGCLEVVRYLVVEAGADPCCRSNEESSGVDATPLHLAAAGDRVEVVKFLCERSVECVFVKNSQEQTPLQVALQCGSHSTAL